MFTNGSHGSGGGAFVDQGMSVYVTSNGSLDVCPENSLDTFQNVFDQPIRLNDNESYQVALANYSIPAFEAKLYALDYEKSAINYNIGIFSFNKKSRQYETVPGLNHNLFSLAPNKPIFGVPTEYDTFNIKSVFNDPVMDTSGGMPTGRLARVNYIKRLLHSLILDPKLNQSDSLQQSEFLNLIKQAFAKHPIVDKSPDATADAAVAVTLPAPGTGLQHGKKWGWCQLR